MKVSPAKISAVFLAIAVVIFAAVEVILNKMHTPTPSVLPNEEPVVQNGGVPSVTVVAENLDTPWEIAFLPDGEILLTQRNGELVKLNPEREVTKIVGVREYGEGGLLGMALHPEFEENRYIYLYSSSAGDRGTVNRVERYRLEGASVSERLVLLDNIPGAIYHDGGRIEFGPDGYLYITTGDATKTANAQNKDSLAGKILRLTDEGKIPADNPFGNAVYSYGHRNPQGLAWDDKGRLWATEHGRSGVQSGMDEVNLIIKGENYGWPTIEGDEFADGMKTPIVNSGANETWAPGDIEYFNGALYFAGLRGESLYKAVIGEDGLELSALYRGEFGRLRAVRIGPDGDLYITTSNKDGRGKPKDGDDKLIKLSL